MKGDHLIAYIVTAQMVRTMLFLKIYVQLFRQRNSPQRWKCYAVGFSDVRIVGFPPGPHVGPRNPIPAGIVITWARCCAWRTVG